jgi:hypothetical protein
MLPAGQRERFIHVMLALLNALILACNTRESHTSLHDGHQLTVAKKIM